VPIDDFASLFGAHGVEAPYELCDSYRRVEAGRAALAQLAASGNGYIAQIGPNAAADTLPGGYLAGIWGGDDGVYLDDIGGSVNVMNGAGIIVGLADDGVSASNVGGHFELSNSGTDQNPTLGGIVAGGEAGVRLRGIGDGVDIFNGVGTIYGESDGIDARYVTGDLLVSNDAGGLIQGLYGDGIRIRDADKVTITNNGGDIFGGDRALYVRSSGDVVINNWGGNIVGDGSWDEAVIRLRSNDSSTVNNSGIIASFATPHSTETWSLPTVDGNDADAWAAFDLSKGAGWTFDAAAIWDDFNVLEGFISGAGTGADGMVAYSGAAADMAIRSSDDTTTINNKAGGILIGRVNLDGSWSGDGSKIVNDGIWITRGTSEVHGTTGDDTITNNAAALIIAAVDGTKNATTTFESDVFTNNGLISMADGGVGDRVYIRGDSYVGGGTVFVDANLNNGSLGSDQFRVRTDEISGTTAIAVRLVDRGGHVDDRVEVANYNGAGTVAADAYVLSSDSDNYISIGGTGYIEDGLVAWSLQADSWNGHDLVAGWGPGALSSAGVITGAQNIFYDPVSIVEDHSYGGQFARSGGGGADLVLPEPAAPGSASDVAVWVKGSGSLTTRDTTVTVNAVPFNTGFDQRIFSLIGGADVTPHGGVFRAGAFGGVVGSAIDFNLPGASAEYMGGTVGAYGAYNDGALFADVTAKADLLAVTYNYAGTSVDAASTSIGVLGNVGYRVALGNGVFVEPIASGAVVGTQITDVGGINFQDALSIRGGVGAKIGTNVPLESYNAEIALLGRVWNEFGGPNSTVVTDGVNTLTVNDNSGGLYGELVGTATVKNLEGNMSGFTSVGATFSANSLSFGGKAGLRVGF
jgi:hypothetical protein